jgi:hypothetical protein
MTSQDLHGDVDVGQVIGRAGPRPPIESARAARVRAAVESAWRAAVRRRRRRRRAAWLGAGLASAAAVIVAVWRPWSAGAPAPVAVTPATVATVTAVNGDVSRNSADGRSARIAVGESIAAGVWFEARESGMAAVSLAGGGDVRIDRGSRIRFDASRVLALERGRIYLDVVASQGGVTIATPAGVVRDVGTRFEVQMADGTLRLRVREGAVQLDRVGRTDRTSAGTEVAVTGEIVTTRAATRYGPSWDWITLAAPAFKVEGATLDAFLTWAVREGGWTLDVPEAGVRDRARGTVLHGDVAGLTAAEAVAVVLPTCGLRATWSTGRMVVRTAGEKGGAR